MPETGERLSRDDSLAVAARTIHALVCGCDHEDWCDSVYLVAAEVATAAFHDAEAHRARVDVARAFRSIGVRVFDA